MGIVHEILLEASRSPFALKYKESLKDYQNRKHVAMNLRISNNYLFGLGTNVELTGWIMYLISEKIASNSATIVAFVGKAS